MTRRLGIVIPAHNEEACLPDVLRRTWGSVPEEFTCRLVVCDNASTDGTGVQAREAGAEVVREESRGYGIACQSAIRRLGSWPEVLLFLDADGSSRPEEIPRLLAPILGCQADLVLGCRPADSVMTLPQRWGTRLATRLIRLRWGRRYSDMGPFRAIRRSALESLGMRDQTWGWTVEMQILALQKGLRVLEVPVSWEQRLAGVSKISGTLSGVARAGARILWTITRYSV